MLKEASSKTNFLAFLASNTDWQRVPVLQRKTQLEKLIKLRKTVMKDWIADMGKKEGRRSLGSGVVYEVIKV